MNQQPLDPREEGRHLPPFRLGWEVSILLHGVLLWGLARGHPREGLSLSWTHRDPLELDLTRPFRLTSDPHKQFQSTRPGTGAPRVERPTPEPFKAGGGVAAWGTEWTLPTPETKQLEHPTDFGHSLASSTVPSQGIGTAEGESRGLGGWGTGGDGEVDWVYLTETPRLLNRDELIKNIRRFYPEAERRAGREGRVVMQVHLNREGQVSGVDVAISGGVLFDEAAQKILSLARFSPASAGERTVAVKFSQAIDFRLSE